MDVDHWRKSVFSGGAGFLKFALSLHVIMEEAIIRYTLTKAERLSGKRTFEKLVTSGQGFVAYPLRVVWQLVPREESMPPVRIAVSVSKRRFKRAVKRNRVKRLVREAYRLNKHSLHALVPPDRSLHLLFVYLHDELPDYPKIEKAIAHVTRKLAQLLALPGGVDATAAD